MKHEHKHFLARLLIGAFLIFGIGFWINNFFVHASGQGSCTWYETEFINNEFWTCGNGPVDSAIIDRTFGVTGNVVTTYTMGRSGYTSNSCLSGGMTVQRLTGGINTIPFVLTGNNIYVLQSGNYITTGTIEFSGDCIGVVGNGDVNIYSTGIINKIFSLSGNQFTIIDNIHIDGSYDGNSSTHGPNSYGIDVESLAHSMTIHGLHSSNNAGGLHLYNVSRININNSLFFNNTQKGLRIANSSPATGYITINNSLFFQNSVGLFSINSHGNIINNSSFFNNSDQGIALDTSNSTILNNISSYNNGDGLEITTSTGNKYYGTLRVFGNGTGFDGTTGNDEYLTGGDAADYSLGWATGTLDTGGTVTYANIINPKNSQDDYILEWNVTTGLITYGQQTWTGVSPITYSFGPEIMQQIQGIIYSGTDLITGGSFSGDYFIGSSTKITTGEISVDGNLVSGYIYVNSEYITALITGNGSSPYINFSLSYGTTRENGIPFSSITTSHSISLISPDDGTGYLFTQLRSDGNRATHYMTEFILDSLAPVITGTVLPGTGTISNNGYYNTYTGITLEFSDIYLSGATLSGTVLSGTTTTGYWSGNFASNTTITGEGVYEIMVYDIAGNSTGKTFTIDRTKPLVSSIYPTSGSTISGANTIAFIWSGTETNLSGYMFYISGTNVSFTGSYATGATGCSYSLGNGTYYWYIVSTDKAGNTGASTPIQFTLMVPLTGSITKTGTTMILSGTSTWYTKDYASFTLRSNKNSAFSITGDIVLSPYTGVTNSTSTTVYNLLLTTGSDGIKYLYATFSTGLDESGTALRSVYLDTIAPSVPTLLTPTSGATVSGTTIGLTWSTAIDSGVGLSGYRWYVSTTGTFATITLSGFTTSASATITSTTLGTTSGTFYWKVIAVDKLGWTGQSSYRDFYYSGAVDTIPDTFTFTSITNARLDRDYRSSTGTITGMTAGVYSLASLNRGTLYINGVETGSVGYVKNGDTVNIEIVSSDEYDHTVTSTLTIGGITTTFRVTTEEEDTSNGTDYSDISTTLSNTEKLQIIAIFEALRDLYNGDKEVEFFNSLMVMLESKIDDLGTSSDDENRRDSLQYLYDLAEQYYDAGLSDSSSDISSTSRIINGVYTAPNGKRYTITYDSAKKQFTSTNFITPKYFPTLDVLKYTIDINNRAGSQYANATTIQARWGRVSIDGTRQTSPYTAPNRKVYYFFKTIDGQYTSYTFTTERYFNSLEEVKEYIYNSNR